MNDKERLEQYLADLEKEPVSLQYNQAETVRKLWHKLSSRIEGLDIPGISSRDEYDFGEYMVRFWWWVRRDYYLDIDIRSDGTFEWFFMDSILNQTDGSDDERLTELPDILIEYLGAYFSKITSY